MSKTPIKLIGMLGAATLASLPILFAEDTAAAWKVRSLTSALALTGVEESPSIKTVSLRNASDKAITAFAVSLSAGADRYTHYVDFYGAQPTGLGPLEVHRVKIPITEFKDANGVLQIDAVVFEDGSSDGSSAAISFVTAKRLGRIMETERIRAILGPLASQYNNDANLNALRSVGTLPASAEEAFKSLEQVHIDGVSLDALRKLDTYTLSGFLEGVRNSREDGLWKLRDVDRLPVASLDATVPARAAAFAQVRQLFEEKSAWYRAHWSGTLGTGANQ
jgi:hypothetical protein